MPAGPEYVRPQLLQNGPILLAPPDPDWPRQYAQVATRIQDALGPDAAVEHVGSTSVPDLAAKPILDVLLLVPDPADEATYVPHLEAAGFLLHLREPNWFEHRLLTGADPAVNLHVLAPSAAEARRMVLFRDRLRADRADRELYEATKRRLAAQDWHRIQDYADAKAEVVAAILTRASSS